MTIPTMSVMRRRERTIRCRVARVICLGALAVFALPAAAREIPRPPVIRHSPPRTALRGRSLVLRAQVTPGSAPIRSVTLYGTSSRDAAPFPLPMSDAGAGAYVVTVPGSLVGEGDEFTYYIEALDTLEAAGETPWHSVRLRSPTREDPPDASGEETRRRAGWVTPTLIAGGATVVVGGVALAARRSSGSSSSDNGTPEPGRLSGTVTRILRVEQSTVESHGFTLIITADGRIRSDDLHPNRSMEATMTGSTFVLVADVAVDGMQGQIRYTGSVARDQVAGSIDGEITGADGRRGTYSGSFSGMRQ